MKFKIQQKLWLLVISICSLPYYYARFGGGGGRSGRRGGSSHSHSHGSSHSSSYSGSSYYGSGGTYSGGRGWFVLVMFIVFAIIIWALYSYAKQKYPNIVNSRSNKNDDANFYQPKNLEFPDGLDENKLKTAFVALQDAWQKKDIRNVRKWISDGMYQRLHTQFALMNLLDQRNILTNINIEEISVVDKREDFGYDVVDVYFSFTVDDAFVSGKYPQFNENYAGDLAEENWTFIRKKDHSAKDLYNTNSCPNCGNSIAENLGEISRCENCNTLINNEFYDWILCEITQEEDYEPSQPLIFDQNLKTLLKNDPEFSIQKMEDISSNIFMQIMESFVTGNTAKWNKFASPETVSKLETLKRKYENILLNRLYINSSTVNFYKNENGRIDLIVTVSATYTPINKQDFRILGEFLQQDFRLVLSRDADIKPSQQTIYSHECPFCGAPYPDTTADVCAYCGAPTADPAQMWVLTDFVEMKIR